jgi:hypothetical protein
MTPYGHGGWVEAGQLRTADVCIVVRRMRQAECDGDFCSFPLTFFKCSTMLWVVATVTRGKAMLDTRLETCRETLEDRP